MFCEIYKRFNIKRGVIKLGFYLLTIILLIYFLFPFIWMILTSLKTSVEVTTYPPVWIFRPSWAAYQKILFETDFIRYLINSSIISVIAVITGVALALPAAYSIVRYKQNKISLLILLVRIIPAMSYMLPLFIIYQYLGIIDTYLGLILVHLIIVLPLSVWILMGFIEDIPKELEDAAAIDGCSRTGTFFKIVVPLLKPGIIVVTILSLIGTWNCFIFFLVLGGHRTITLPMSVYNFISFEYIDFPALTAAAALMILPIMILAVVLQRYLIRGLTFGAVKG